eukprot:352498-Chlamydomonas_euryale.AAC.6
MVTLMLLSKTDMRIIVSSFVMLTTWFGVYPKREVSHFRDQLHEDAVGREIPYDFGYSTRETQEACACTTSSTSAQMCRRMRLVHSA